ncbi:MAG: aldo/keto reductase [Steroidobacteraceae bacterium]
MQTRALGSQGVQLPAIGLGCMTLIGWYGIRNDDEARATVAEALERGIVHFDTASSYQNGANEEFVGELLRGRRQQLFIASKYGITRNAEGGLVIDNHPDSLRRAVDASLQRLGMDYIDLYYLHRIDPQVPIEESVGALKALVQAGKLRHIGLSECSVDTLRRAHAVHPVTAVQSEYSLWTRDPEAGILQTCRELGIGFVAYSPLGRGFLAGNFGSLSELPEDDTRRTHPRFAADNAAHNLKLVELIRHFAADKSVSPAQVAIAWVLAQGTHVHVIPGMKTRTHLRDNLAAMNLDVTAAEWRVLADRIVELAACGDRYPPAMLAAIGR